MSAIAIDTLTFSDLVKLGLEDIPGASRREWTQHGAVDPGITLLEVLAWQLEQRLFMAEQLTEPMVRASLRLLGVDEPEPAKSAVTVLSVQSGEARAGTVLTLADGRAFTTEDALTVQPVSAVETGDGLELALRLDGPGEGELSLLVELAAAPRVAPAWSADAVDVQPAARLRWEAIGPAGTVATVEVADTTGALRRSGLLRLAWPAVWDKPAPSCRACGRSSWKVPSPSPSASSASRPTRSSHGTAWPPRSTWASNWRRSCRCPGSGSSSTAPPDGCSTTPS